MSAHGPSEVWQVAQLVQAGLVKVAQVQVHDVAVVSRALGLLLIVLHRRVRACVYDCALKVSRDRV